MPAMRRKIPLRDRSDARPLEKPARKSDAKATIIVGAVFGALGLAALGFGSVLAARQFRIITSWKRAESEVVKSQLVQSRGLRGLFHYNLKVQFRYAMDGREYFFIAAAGVTAFGLIFAAAGFGMLIAMARSKTKPCLACGRMLQKQYRFCPKCAAPAG